MGIKNRVERIERALGMEDEDELIELDVGDGKPFVMTNRELDELLKEISNNPHSRLMPKD